MKAMSLYDILAALHGASSTVTALSLLVQPKTSEEMDLPSVDVIGGMFLGLQTTLDRLSDEIETAWYERNQEGEKS